MTNKQSGPGNTHSTRKSSRDKDKNVVEAASDKAEKNHPAVTGGKDTQAVTDTQFPVVAIGASAGGLAALNTLCEAMPVDTGMAFVIITHQQPSHVSLLPEILARKTALPVNEVTDDMPIEPNHIYVGPPGHELDLEKDVLKFHNNTNKQVLHTPIDHFCRTLAQARGKKSIAIILSGTGSDGAIGVKQIKGEAGMVMVQQPDTAEYAGMPASAISTGTADFILPPEKMPEQLVEYVKGGYISRKQEQGETIAIPDNILSKIFLLLKNRTGHDFSSYKRSSICRRIERRMNVLHIENSTTYMQHLQENPHEIDFLFKDVLISVTSFFRDADAWKTLEKQLTELIRTYPEGYTIRAWVPGCATGEEAYSLAILLRELMNKLGRFMDVQIFATDIDEQTVDIARAGFFTSGITMDLSAERLAHFFVEEETGYRIRKDVREMVIFASQNIIKDPPFIRLDILCCRNLLIYMNSELQKKLLPVFHYALKPGGLLFLGPSETIGNLSELFEPVDKRWKIYSRRETVLNVKPDIPVRLASDHGSEKVTAKLPVKENLNRTVSLIQKYLLDLFAPSSAVVNDRGDIVYIQGKMGDYLEPPQGEPRNNVLEMAREGLRLPLTAIIRESLSRDTRVTQQGIVVRYQGEEKKVNISAQKVLQPESLRGLIVISFRPVPEKSAAAGKKTSVEKPAADRIITMEQELKFLNESNATAREELETMNEELRSTNEELQSANEELQSTNEELETSKEEMQSLNEELSTVNAELQSKVDELSQTSDDMQNLLNSTDIATLYLDNDLKIKRFTQQINKLVNVVKSDVGRSLTDFAWKIDGSVLLNECQSVLDSLVTRETEVKAADGRCYLLRILPYRTAENVIDGLVLTFTDITKLKSRETSSDFYTSIFNSLRMPMLVVNNNLLIETANSAYCRIFHHNAEEPVGRLISDVAENIWGNPGLIEQLEKVLTANEEMKDFHINVNLESLGLGQQGFRLNARRLTQENADDKKLIISFQPVNESVLKDSAVKIQDEEK